MDWSREESFTEEPLKEGATAISLFVLNKIKTAYFKGLDRLNKTNCVNGANSTDSTV